MGTTLSTGIGNRHEERCICPLVGGGKMTLHHPRHLKVSQIIAFHKRVYNESKAIIAQYVVSNTT